MNQNRRALTGLAALIATAALTAGCAGVDPAVPTVSPSIGPQQTISTPAAQAPQVTSAAPGRDHRGRSGAGNRSAAATAALPPSWPTDVPIPPGSLTGSTASAGRWTVLLLAAGSAAQARQSAVDFYVAAGFIPVSDSVLNKGHRQITLVAENQDHSATQTNLVIAATTT